MAEVLTMVRTLKARFSKGVFEPLDPHATALVREGEEVLITISTAPEGRPGDPLKDTAGGWKDLIDAEALKKNIYADRLVSSRPGVRF